MPRISIITVSFNARDALVRTMASVSAQDYADREYIVVDGASRDGTHDVLRHCDSQITRWVSEPDRGIYDAMNKGVGMATGDYCIFMNAGDLFASPTTLSEVVAEMNGSDVAYGDIVKNGRRKAALSPRNCHKMYYCHQAVLVRTEVLRAYPFDIRHRFSADFKQAKQLYLAGCTFQQLRVVVADYDTHGVSNTQRAAGLWDNIRVVREVDGVCDQLRFLPRLLFTYAMARLRQ